MALRASKTGLEVLCVVSLLLVSSVANANETPGAHGAERKIMSYDDYAPGSVPSYGRPRPIPSYGTPTPTPTYGTPPPPTPTYGPPAKP
ncbi:hypothetical protein BS78_07G095800 [Paspalum vaginatum]|nr:hypothetical protein BS78_07G095800 [Paspalum vaginatum]